MKEDGVVVKADAGPFQFSPDRERHTVESYPLSDLPLGHGSDDGAVCGEIALLLFFHPGHDREVVFRVESDKKRVSKNAAVRDKISFDIWYIRNRSMLLDLKLFLVSFVISFLGRWEAEVDKIGILMNMREKIKAVKWEE